MVYEERRSKRALAIDRSLQAKTVFSGFEPKYVSAPNMSDVQDYDTRFKDKLPPQPLPKPYSVPKTKEKVEGVYEPSKDERKKLIKVFHSLKPIEQHKDLLTTRNVIRSSAEVHKWEREPKWYDIHGIDTAPPELLEERKRVLLGYAKNPKVERRSYLSKNALGQFRFHKRMIENTGIIRMRSSLKGKDFYKTFFHETGHALDRNRYAKVDNSGFFRRLDVGSFNFGARKPMRFLGDTSLSFGKMNNLGLKIGDVEKRNKERVELVTRTKLSPYDIKKLESSNPYERHEYRKFHGYRTTPHELFANWFSGFVTKKNVVKRESRGFYNIFRKSDKDLFRALRKSDLAVTSKYMKGVI